MPTTERVEPRWGQFALVVALVVCVVVAAGGAGFAGYLIMQANAPEGQDWPPNWDSTGFVVRNDANWATRERVGELLVLLSRAEARYVVRPHGVEVAVQPGERDALDRIRATLPLRSDLTIRPVRSTPHVTTADCPAGVTCDLSGARYDLAEPVLTGDQIRTATADGDDVGSGWHVTLRLTNKGNRAMSAATGDTASGDTSAGAAAAGGATAGEQVERRLAVVVAGVVVMTPTVLGPVSGPVQLTGNFDAEQSHRLAAAFQLGRDPVGIALGNPG
ncbi:MAG: hypothetical protein WCA46_13715 [Actinocatenispora sp.]